MVDDIHKLRIRLFDIRDELTALDKQARDLRLERATVIRTIIDQRGWKHVAQLLGVGSSRVYAMVQPTYESPRWSGQNKRLQRSPNASVSDSPPDAERRGTGSQPDTPPPATPKEQAWRTRV